MSKNKKAVKGIQDKPVSNESAPVSVEKKENAVTQKLVKIPCPRCKKDTEGKDFCGDCGRKRIL